MILAIIPFLACGAGYVICLAISEIVKYFIISLKLLLQLLKLCDIL